MRSTWAWCFASQYMASYTRGGKGEGKGWKEMDGRKVSYQEEHGVCGTGEQIRTVAAHGDVSATVGTKVGIALRG